MSTEDEKLLKEAKKLPWEDLLMHTNWKVRNNANVDLATLCDSISDPKDPRLREFEAAWPIAPGGFVVGELSGLFFRKTVADLNVPVQEKALDALISFLKAADADVGRYAKEVCDAIIANCLTGRPKIVEKSPMVFMLWIELEAVDAFLESRLLWLFLAKLRWRLDNLGVQAPNSKYLQSGRGLWTTTPSDMSYTCKRSYREQVLLLCFGNLETMGVFTMVAIMMQLSGMSSLYAVFLGASGLAISVSEKKASLASRKGYINEGKPIDTIKFAL
ncbi:hypothetical protein RHSIM_RhsimUnG0099400 [Rhododendron simsii]|uniref:XMAP215/Dis1/CLASP TOG domain-containing protein n=1 Tax=Rhododendron simsii TaxID=118357 RepID=A0A834L4Z0_RHOSS|nr:hypothetical protein RHSIM_RhsimUnG0099400 [Rhododendron simsii]